MRCASDHSVWYHTYSPSKVNYSKFTLFFILYKLCDECNLKNSVLFFIHSPPEINLQDARILNANKYYIFEKLYF